MGTRARTFFWGTDKEISEKRNFFVNRSVPENFQKENFSGQVPSESLRTQDSENLYERGVQKLPMGISDLRGEAQFRRFWEIFFFCDTELMIIGK